MDDIKLAILELLEKEGVIDYSPKALSRRIEINSSVSGVSIALNELKNDGFIEYNVSSTGEYSYKLAKDFQI